MRVAATGAASVSAVRWIGATFAGWSGGFVFAILLLVGVESIGVRQVQFPLALGMSLGVGFTQARLFGAQLVRRWWIAMTATGLTAPFLLRDVAQLLDLAIPYNLAVYVAIGGACAGLLQYLLLRLVYGRAASWLAAAPLGWVLAAAAVVVNDRFMPRIPGIIGALIYIFVILAGGLLLGFTGAPAIRTITGRPAGVVAGTDSVMRSPQA